MLKDGVEMTVAQKAWRLLQAANGADNAIDYEIVMDTADGYIEPGYRLTMEDGVIVFGNWNFKRHRPMEMVNGQWVRTGPPLTKDESKPARLARALEFIGADIEWYDEWTTCSECYRAMRTQADSYSWTMNGAFIEDGYVCAECMSADPESYLDEYKNNPRNALTWVGGTELEAIGFVQWEPGNEQQYESGWHPGQTDDPTKVLEAIRKWQDDDKPVDVVFLIDGVGQFDVRWSAYVRPEDYEPDNDNGEG